MEQAKVNVGKIGPVLFSFFVMSFVDLVGIGVDRVKADMGLSATLAQLIPSAAFLWFLLLSVWVGTLQDRVGKKKMLNVGMLITALGLLLPFLSYSFVMVLIGFALLGIGNTIVQVSANPLLVDVVPGSRTSSFLSFSQFVKSVGSMLGAPLAALFATRFGDWKILFLVFGVVSILAVLWLSLVKIEETASRREKASMASSFKLLGSGFVFSMVLSIFLVVGIDVGFNANSGQFLMNKLGLEQTIAESGRSVYFFGRMLGTFLGALLLAFVSTRPFLISTSILSLAAILALLIAPGQTVAMIIIFIIGFGVANIFPLVYAIAVKRLPERKNEISGLVMMAVSGGAVIPLLMGFLSDRIGISAGMIVPAVCTLVILAIALRTRERAV